MYYIIYRTTNKINGKIYVGKHKTDKLDDCYLGSGKLLIRAVEKYGRENFEREILHIFLTEDEMNAKEAEIVTEDFCNDEMTYNLTPGGQGGFGYINSRGFGDRTGAKLSDETKEKLRQKKIGTTLSDEARAKISENNKRTNASRGIKNSLALTGKRKSEEHKKKIALSVKQSYCRKQIVVTPKFVWGIKTPSGTIEETTNLTKYCKENKLHSSRIYNGYKGYLVVKKEPYIVRT